MVRKLPDVDPGSRIAIDRSEWTTAQRRQVSLGKGLERASCQSSRRASFRLLTSIRSWSRLAARFIASRASYPQNLRGLP